MASFKLNIAKMRGCPAPREVAEALEEFGLPDSQEYGVLNYSLGGDAVYATIVRKTQQTVQRLDAEAKEVTAAVVEKAAAYPFGVHPTRGVLEIYAGSAGAIEQVGVFFSSCLAMPTIVEPIKLDVASSIEKLRTATDRFQLRSARVTDYAHNSFMIGTYAPKFLDSQHGKDFVDEYVENTAAAVVRFAGPGGKINVTLGQKACFSFSCGEDDQPFAQSILRKLI